MSADEPFADDTRSTAARIAATASLLKSTAARAVTAPALSTAAATTLVSRISTPTVIRRALPIHPSSRYGDGAFVHRRGAVPPSLNPDGTGRDRSVRPAW